MKKILINLAIALMATTISFAQGGGIRAKVLDEKGKPLPFATVVLKTDKVINGQITDNNGWFHFKGLTGGIYNIEISSMGLTTRKITGINVSDGNTAYLENIKLTTNTNTIGIVNISDKATVKLIDPGDPSAKKLDSKVIEKIPGGNTMSSIITTISTDIQVTEDKQNIVVRGSRPGNSAFYIDGVRSESMSAVSGGNIKNMTVYSGGIPAAYGDITGGVVIIETKSYFDFYYKWKAEQSRK